MSFKPKKQIGVGDLILSPRAKQYVNQALDNNRLSYGPFHVKFENMFAKEHDCRYACFCNSGASALQIALAALKIKYGWSDGDEVIVPAVTFVATVNVIFQNNLIPVLVDVDEKTFNIDPDKIEEKITPKTRCILPVHLLGLPADMEPIQRIAKKHSLRIVEDSAECMFAAVNGKKVGSLGDIGCFSTYMAHFIITGVGGLVTTNDPELAILMKSLINHGRDSIYLNIDDDKKEDEKELFEVVARRFRFTNIGFSYRATEMEAAIGVSQMEQKDFIISKRKENADFFTKALAPLQEFIRLPTIPKGRTHTFMIYGLTVLKEEKRNLVNFLEKNLIETRDLLPLTSQPYLKNLLGEDIEELFPVAKKINHHSFYIGCHPYMTEEELNFVVDKFFEYFGVERHDV